MSVWWTSVFHPIVASIRFYCQLGSQPLLRLCLSSVAIAMDLHLSLLFQVPVCGHLGGSVCSVPERWIHQFCQGVLSTHCAVDARWMWCFQCQRRQDFPLQSVTMESTPDPNRFTHGPLASLGSLHGWRSPPVTQPGTGSQSWLFCPLISLELLATERTHGVQHKIQSRCARQREFWLTHSGDIIRIYSEHLSSLSPMLRWHCSRSGNVVIICQPVCKNCVLLHTLWQLSIAWLSAQCDGFLNCGSVVAPPTTNTDVPEAASPTVSNPLNARTSPASAAILLDNQVPFRGFASRC